MALAACGALLGLVLVAIRQRWRGAAATARGAATGTA